MPIESYGIKQWSNGRYEWLGLSQEQMFLIHRGLAQLGRTYEVNVLLRELNGKGITFEAEHAAEPPIPNPIRQNAQQVHHAADVPTVREALKHQFNRRNPEDHEQ